MSRCCSDEPRRLVAASVGCALPSDRSVYGYLSEHHAFGQTEKVAGDYAEDLAAAMLASTLGVEFDEDKSWDEKREVWKISGKIYRSFNITQSAIVKDEYTTVDRRGRAGLVTKGAGMRGARIIGTGRALPTRVVKNEELTRRMDTSDEWIVQRTGVRERRYVDPGTGSSHLGAEAARKAIANAGITVNDIDLIVFATLSPDHVFPGNGVLVQEQLGMRTVGALDVRDQCTGFVYGLSVAEAYVKGGFHDHVLVIGAEVQSTGLDFSTKGRDVAVIFGDGAGAVVVGPAEPGRGILSSHLHSEGKYAKELWVEAPSFLDNPWITHEMIDAGKHFPKMNGRYVFTHAVRRFPEVIREALEKNGLTVADLSLLIPHQANLRITQAVGAALQLPEEKVFSNVERYGNTTAASIPIALDECVEQGRIREGDIVCLASFGSGFTWASALLRW